MKKIYRKLKSLWLAETPKAAKLSQYLSAVVTAIPLYYTSLPEAFQNAIHPNIIKYIAYGGLLVTVLLQFTKKKDGTEIN